ncbi:hypothetical protein CHS0354_027392 [Potamilus streckersoni]|uniref:Penicillin-binding protein dimerisation domain-containing protein n=1 Tax=Potamilus streckersoni TaxID=2493646 RepID=A0AAE0SQ27_9BIVA|nr:hypothetical protein CHS0354_027392 [Potamilus streckersoni]
MDEYFKYPGQSFEDRINWVKALVIDHDRMDRMAQEKLRKIKAVSVQRGKIIDAEGEILAMSLPVYSRLCLPDKSKTLKKTAKAFLRYWNKKYPLIFSNRRRVYLIQRSISDAQYSALSKADLPGIYFQSEFMRVVPA